MSALDLLTTRLIQDNFQPNLEKLQKQAAAELAELRAELQIANEDAERLYRALKSTDMEFMELEGPALAAHEARIKNPTRKGMTESEYKDYLSEQDRLKREAEEENQ